MKTSIKYFSLILLLTGLIPQGFAQWQTQIFALKQGWNAIYTHVDAKHTTIEQLVQGDGIEEVWMWRPKLSTMQYIQSPDQPLDTVSRWTSWISSNADGSSLQRLIGNAAYLVKAGQAVNWGIKGKPVPPRYQWTSTGLNLIGFSTKSASPPVFSNFLNPVNGFGAGAQIFSYNGGDLGTTNPAQLFTLNTSQVHRGQAYWIRATGYNRYYGPFELGLQDWGGVHFGDSLSSYNVVLKNTTKSDLTVSMQLIDSDAAPVQEGIPTVAGTPPIIVRGDYQLATLTHAYSALNGNTQSWTLKPEGEAGSAVEIRLGVNWAQLSGDAGDSFAGIVRFTDSLGYLQTDLPLSVTKPSTSGLWVGEATVNQVRQAMYTFQKSIVKGQLKAAVNGTPDSPLAVSWLKKQSIQTVPAGKSYVSSDAGYHLLKNNSYPNVSVGDSLSMPPTDENDAQLDDPASYWQARPYHKSYVKGWYYNTGSVVATGDNPSIDMEFVKNTPAGSKLAKKVATGAWHYEKDVTYTGAAVDDALTPPANDESGATLTNPLVYWSIVSGTLQDDDNPTWAQADDGSYKAVVAGNITLQWRKISAEEAEYAEFSTAIDPSVIAGGSGYAVNDIVTVSGGTKTIPAKFVVKTISGDGSVAGLYPLSEAVSDNSSANSGVYSVIPPNAVATTSGGVGIGLTLNITWSIKQFEHRTVTKTVFPKQRLTDYHIYDEDMPQADWSIYNPPERPPFEWEGELLTDGESGSYVVAHIDNSWGAVQKPMTLRVIVHNNGDSTPVANLLQRVYLGFDDASYSLLLATGPKLLPDATPDVRRISAVHLPWNQANRPWPFTGGFAKGGALATTVTVEHDDHASNPFLHTYHPDHDNLDGRFEKKLSQGNESYQIKREIELRLNGSQTGFSGLTMGGSALSGEYEEIVTLSGKAKPNGSGNETRQYGMKGSVTFRRITPLATLRTD